MAYFKNVNTLEELRKQYKELLKIHHPDNGGNMSDMQEINAEYDRLFQLIKDRHDSKTTDKENTSYDNMKYDFSEDRALRDMLNEIIGFSGITIHHTLNLMSQNPRQNIFIFLFSIRYIKYQIR